MDIKDFYHNNKNRIYEELFSLLRIPSVSADKKYKESIDIAASLLCSYLAEVGSDKTAVMETEGNPVVYAEKIIDNNLPTVLVYGHYDVQPADPEELWGTPPFEPVIKNGKIYGRGAADDKGQLFIHVKALEWMNQ